MSQDEDGKRKRRHSRHWPFGRPGEKHFFLFLKTCNLATSCKDINKQKGKKNKGHGHRLACGHFGHSLDWGKSGLAARSEKQPAGHESFLFSIQWRRFDANKKWEMGAGKEEKNKVRTTKRVEKEEEEEGEEEEARGTAGKLGSSGESLTLRRAAPGPGRSGAAAAAGGSRCLQQPSTPGFSSFYNEPTPPRAQKHPAAANKGLDGALKGIPGGNRK